MTSDYMAQALAEARKGLGQTSPNPAVGSLVVKDGVVVGRGYHTFANRKHAEVVALEDAGERARGRRCMCRWSRARTRGGRGRAPMR